MFRQLSIFFLVLLGAGVASANEVYDVDGFPHGRRIRIEHPDRLLIAYTPMGTFILDIVGIGPRRMRGYSAKGSELEIWVSGGRVGGYVTFGPGHDVRDEFTGTVVASGK